MQKDCRNNPCRRITRTLVRAGVLVEQPEQPFLDLSFDSPLEQLCATAIRYLIAVGPQAGRATMRLHDPSAVDDSPQSTKPFTAARDGFSVNCAVACEAHERAKLERVCRYMARPPSPRTVSASMVMAWWSTS